MQRVESDELIRGTESRKIRGVFSERTGNERITISNEPRINPTNPNKPMTILNAIGWGMIGGGMALLFHLYFPRHSPSIKVVGRISTAIVISLGVALAILLI